MGFKATHEQGQAINAKGNILVSAAAGSGKTAVLVERVIKKLCSDTDSVSADRLLIVTFTNAAAAEMRTRIEKRLDEECRNDPNNVSLTLQRHKLASAKICTIDSFCIDLVRENFDKLDVSPDFKMSDGNSLKPINEAVITEIINRYLTEKDPVFLELLDLIGAEYDENNFKEFVLKLYDFSRQLPFPEKWFDSLSGYYNGGIFDENSIWWKYAFEKARRIIDGNINSLLNAIDLISVNEKAYEGYIKSFNDAKVSLDLLKAKCESNDWNEFYNALNSFFLSSLPIKRGLGDIFEVSAAKEIYKYIGGKSLEKLKAIFYNDTSFINAQFSKLAKPLALLSEILKEFDQKLFLEYKEQNTFTFHNTEHLALKLLCRLNGDTIEINPDATELLDHYHEVMVDEYQDTNDLQDMLFYVLSGEEKRLFVVGDVKQSIYGFRGANPNNFLNKKNRYIPIDDTDSNHPQKIILGNNFRCKPDVCEFINYFFTMFMNNETGEIIYNDEEKLIPAATYPETNKVSTEFHIVNCKGSCESDSVLEARHIAEFIKETMGLGNVIKEDDNNLRKAKYSDFTILLRSAKLKGPVFAEELKKQGIPVNYNVEDFYESTEIATFLSLLSVIDNPESDIDLLTVMLSPLFGFTPEEMAKIKINNRHGSLYSAVIYAAKNGNNKVKEFLNTLQAYRYIEITNTLPKFISILLNKTGYLDIVSAMNDGGRRRNNLLLLCSYSEQYITGNDTSLGGFVKYIIKQSDSGIKAAVSPSGGDTVKIMSIHASKGLQFPVCIIAGTASDFNDSEARESALYSTESGIGFKYYDEELKTKLTTVSREVILDIARTKRLEEELRLFYVALTRTQDKLLITSAVSDAEKKADSMKVLLSSNNGEICRDIFQRTKSYNDWMFLSLLLHPDGEILRGTGHGMIVKETNSRIDVKVINFEDIKGLDDTNNYKTEIIIDSEITDKIRRNISFEYPFADILSVEAKASVSRLANSAESAKYAFNYTPAFLQEGGITPTERGTAMHKVMQYFDFEKYNNLDEELNRLYEWQYISEREYNAIDKKLLADFFNSDVFKRILSAIRVEREMRFLTEVSAKKIAPELNDNYSDEKIIVQGAVDVCFIEDDGIVILDFKTDRVKDLSILAETYGEQLNIYAVACEKIFGLPVKQKIIYSFALSKEIEV